MNAGKPARYIIGKLKAKGISPSQVEDILAQQEYNPFETALKFARRKKIGPFRLAESRAQFKQKDMAALVRAGFDYNTVCEVLNYETDNE